MVSEKTMKTVVIVLGILLLAGFAVVVGTIVIRLGDDEAAAPPASGGGDEILLPAIAGRELKLPPGSTVEGVTGNERVLVVHARTREGRERVIVFDRVSGEILSDVELAPE